MELAGKVCLVTGGTKGIGAATAIALARRGALVAVVGRNLQDAESKQTIEALKATGQRTLVIRGDMGNAGDCRACVEQTAAQLGPVDVLIHSAGGLVAGGLFEVSEESWMKGFDVHVHAIFHLCRAVVPAMKKKGEGAIILISSSAGKRAIRTNIAYQAVKGAIPHIARGLAFELADNNIRVNCVAPGVIRTAFHNSMPESVKENNLKNRIPLHREGTSEQVASLILEMTTNDYITGETFSIDGGLTMRIC
ncbi:MAG TPA: SDR family oxidoreductase [Humisphaera sp.]|nr:SDR family oxidoreductase [Humisphaera sp.]